MVAQFWYLWVIFFFIFYFFGLTFSYSHNELERAKQLTGSRNLLERKKKNTYNLPFGYSIEPAPLVWISHIWYIGIWQFSIKIGWFRSKLGVLIYKTKTCIFLNRPIRCF